MVSNTAVLYIFSIKVRIYSLIPCSYYILTHLTSVSAHDKAVAGCDCVSTHVSAHVSAHDKAFTGCDYVSTHISARVSAHDKLYR